MVESYFPKSHEFVKKVQSQKMQEILDDLCIRFIHNVPDEDFQSVERLFFNIEEAYWFYSDYYLSQAKKEGYFLPDLSFADFADSIVAHSPFLAEFRYAVEVHTKKFLNYKDKIPAYGAIIFNQTYDKILLIQGCNSNTWSFPKGKIHKHETEMQCAIREVKEEIGFDISPLVQEKLFIVKNKKGQSTKLFIVGGVDENTKFSTQTRFEVEKIRWHRLESLSNNNIQAPRKSNLVHLFLKDILDFAWEKKSKTISYQRRRSPTSTKSPVTPSKSKGHRKQYSPPIYKQQAPSPVNHFVPPLVAEKKLPGIFSFNAEEIVNAV